MLRFLFFSLLFFSLSSNAQVNLWIDSNWPFKIGVDGYVQNTEAVAALFIQKLDTSEHTITIDLYTEGDTVKLFRKLQLIEGGNHKYILTKNFKGKYQLRYRGQQNDIPTGIISLSLQKVLPWPKEISPVTATVINSETTETPDTTTSTSSAEKPVAKAEVDTNSSFATVLFDIQKTKFEFEKLKKASAYTESNELTTNQVRLILNALDYDLTRIQFIKTVKEKVSNPKLLPGLTECFDYDVSKAQFKEIIK